MNEENSSPQEQGIPRESKPTLLQWVFQLLQAPFGPVLIMEPAVMFVLLWFIPWFFTLTRFFLALWQNSNRPNFASMGFRFVYLPGPLLSAGWIQFLTLIFFALMVGFYVNLARKSPNAIRDFQQMDVVSFAGFYVTKFLLMAMLWLPLY